jgi:hypothetical protein
VWYDAGGRQPGLWAQGLHKVREMVARGERVVEGSGPNEKGGFVSSQMKKRNEAWSSGERLSREIAAALYSAAPDEWLALASCHRPSERVGRRR